MDILILSTFLLKYKISRYARSRISAWILTLNFLVVFLESVNLHPKKKGGLVGEENAIDWQFRF